ncbi:LPXTG cell wall anchor domain-containing protein [Bacillus sp. 165]|nr:LPXTG cell wall anchor domain-containing protein [Bacillus sp. 165]
MQSVFAADDEVFQLRIQSGDVEVQNLFESQTRLAPSRTTDVTTVILSNGGSGNLDITSNFTFWVEKDGVSKSELQSMLSKYMVKVVPYYDGEAIDMSSAGLTGDWISVVEFMNKFNKENQIIATLAQDQKFEFQVQVKLLETAGNEFQQANLKGTFTATGAEAVTGTESPGGENPSTGNPVIKVEPTNPLPHTATSMFTYLALGAMLLALGIGVLYWRRIKDVF